MLKGEYDKDQVHSASWYLLEVKNLWSALPASIGKKEVEIDTEVFPFDFIFPYFTEYGWRDV